ncbi:MAG TPA: hypothetical protein VIN77_05965 [Aurantimonas sp.]
MTRGKKLIASAQILTIVSWLQEAVVSVVDGIKAGEGGGMELVRGSLVEPSPFSRQGLGAVHARHLADPNGFCHIAADRTAMLS